MLNQFMLFDKLSNEQLEKLSKHIHVRNYSKKTQIITEGDDSHCLYFVFSGKVKVYLDDDAGKEIIVNTHGEGEFFGELGLIQSIKRTASVVTTEDTRLGVMSETDFRDCLADEPEFALNLINNLVERLKTATETIRQLGLMDVYGRIVVTFLNLSEEMDGKRVIKEKLTQQSIANRVGASREMVARILKDLKVGGYITTESGQIIIHKALPHSW
jgi:CRP/FNR family transcriptional regulator, cyclic AMP receptor protein